jgi:hypothetical protein
MSKRFQLQINNVELKPLSLKESIDFLSRQLCPGPGKRLLDSQAVRRRIKQAGGYYPALELVADEIAEEINCVDDVSDQPILQQWMMVIAVVFIFISVLLWLYVGQGYS